jgi:hypothetical protein
MHREEVVAKGSVVVLLLHPRALKENLLLQEANLDN